MPNTVRPIMQPASPAFVAIKKFDDEQHLVYGEVYAPGIPDSQGDFMTAAEIQKMAHAFLRAGRVTKVDTQHDNRPNGSAIVESFIARDGDPIFIPGSWVVGVHIPDDRIWSMVKSGELNGFSFEGEARKSPREIEIEIPPVIDGLTTEASGHVHKFEAWYDDNGAFVGGQTDVVDGHSHRISAGTITDLANGHRHRFSTIEGMRYGA